jgi:hypothetical protein
MFGNNGWGGGYGAGGFNNALSYDFPWLLQGQNGITNQVTSGFDHAATQSALSGIQSSITSGFGGVALGISGVNQNICQTGNNVVSALTNGFAQTEISANARQMANMNQMFGLSQQFSDCCCENRLANCQTQNVIQSEAAASRYADATNTRDILENQNKNNQVILDKLCQLELDGKNTKIADLERQLTMANLQASQIAQNSFIQQGFSDEVDALYNRLSNCPVPTTPVYGRTPIFTCNNNNGCGCGCGTM